MAEKPVDENLCTRCGKCCYKKIVINGVAHTTPFPCEYLDTATNMCKIYPLRHDINPRCQTVYGGIAGQAYPADCPYVPEHAPADYKAPREDWRWSIFWDEFEALADKLEVSQATRAKIRERGPQAPFMYTEVPKYEPR